MTRSQGSSPSPPGARVAGASVFLAVAVIPTVADARVAEAVLGSRCDQGVIDVFDGILIERADSGSALVWRALRNVPRSAALPEALWLQTTKVWSGGSARQEIPVLPIRSTGPQPGQSALVVIGRPASVLMLESDFRDVGGEVVVRPMSAAWFATLRRSRTSNGRPVFGNNA